MVQADTPKKRSGAVQNGSRKVRLALRAIGQLDGRTRASQQFNKIISAIIQDLGGADRLSEIERRLVTSFAGAAILQEHQLTKLLSGVPVDVHEYASTVTAMIRSVTRLGTDRRSKDITPDLQTYLRGKAGMDEATE